MASSLMKSLARVAAGVIVAKGIGSVMKGAQQNQGRVSQRQTGGGILGDLLGQATGRSTQASGAGGGLGDLLGQVLGGGAASRAGSGRSYGGANSPSTGAQGGLGGILDSLTRSNVPQSGGASGGGLGQILAGGAAAGGLGGLLDGLLGGQAAQAGAQQQNDASFGEVFNDAMARQDEPSVPPTAEQNAVAGLMLAAMIQAAKSDGKIDDREKERLMGQLGDVDDEVRNFVRQQMMAPVDPQALAREVPQGLEQQVYLMSLMAIDFDSQAEAQYLRALANALGLADQQITAIHEQVGVQNLPA